MRVGNKLDILAREVGDLVEVQETAREGGLQRKREGHISLQQTSGVEFRQMEGEVVEVLQRRVEADLVGELEGLLGENGCDLGKAPLEAITLMITCSGRTHGEGDDGELVLQFIHLLLQFFVFDGITLHPIILAQLAFVLVNLCITMLQKPYPVHTVLQAFLLLFPLFRHRIQ